MATALAYSYAPTVGRAVGDSATVLGLVFSIPLVMLAVGTPVALVILGVSLAFQWAFNALSF